MTVALVSGLAMLGIAATPASAIELTGSFDWTMPPRLLENTAVTGHTPPIPQYDPDALMLPPEGWRVDLDACAVTASTIASYEWSVDGAVVGNVSDCVFTHRFPQLGRYQVTLRITDEIGDTAVLEQEVTVQDWLIVAVGDSYGSGEGNPERPVAAEASVDLEALLNRSSDLLAGLRATRERLPGAEQAQAAAQQLRDDAQAAREQAAADLARLQEELEALTIIEADVEGDPRVSAARERIAAAQQRLEETRVARSSAQAAYEECSELSECAALLGPLAAANGEALAANAALAFAEVALFTGRTAALITHSGAILRSPEALNTALSARQAAVNAARNSVNAAQNAYRHASSALQESVTAFDGLEGAIAELENEWDATRRDIVTQYLKDLPVWTATAPSWGTPEPGYAEIVLDGALPGEALRCHRSMMSGQARAALMLEHADPRSSVTLVHLSCSGASIHDGLIGPDNGQPVDSPLSALVAPLITSGLPGVPEQPDITAQLVAAVERIQGREIDALVVSVGANDIRLSRLVQECMLGEPCHEEVAPALNQTGDQTGDQTGNQSGDQFDEALNDAIVEICRPVALINQLTGLSLPAGMSFTFTEQCLAFLDPIGDPGRVEPGAALRTFNDHMFGNEAQGITSLAAKYRDLNEYLTMEFPALDPRRVYITEYPDPTADDSGNYCHWDPDLPSSERARHLPGVTAEENAWAHLTVMTTLREQIETAAALHQWTFVSRLDNGETIGTASRNHGYCAEDNWFVTLPESLVSQQDPLGALHPNSEGHAVYARAIHAQLMRDLYPEGTDQAPRAPSPAAQSVLVADPFGSGGAVGHIGWAPLLILAGFWGWGRTRITR